MLAIMFAMADVELYLQLGDFNSGNVQIGERIRFERCLERNFGVLLVDVYIREERKKWCALRMTG